MGKSTQKGSFDSHVKNQILIFIISFIEDHKVIDKIIAHLKLIFMVERPPPPQIVQQELLVAAEERGEYF